MGKPFEPEDPMALVPVGVPGGQPVEAVRGLVLEYLQLGWSPRRIMSLFERPFFAGSHRLAEEMGLEEVRRIVLELSEAWRAGWRSRGRSDG